MIEEIVNFFKYWHILWLKHQKGWNKTDENYLKGKFMEDLPLR